MPSGSCQALESEIYIHFQTQMHEVLGFARDRLLAQFGGSKGKEIELAAGGVVVFPQALVISG